MVIKKSSLPTLAKKILKMKPGIIALEGPLGAGKTTFTKELAKSLGVEDVILSPTFVLHRQYMGENGITLDHIDCWRMESGAELEQLDLEKMLELGSLVVIEWADMFEEEIKKLRNKGTKIIWVKMEHADRENERRVSYEDLGS